MRLRWSSNPCAHPCSNSIAYAKMRSTPVSELNLVCDLSLCSRRGRRCNASERPRRWRVSHGITQRMEGHLTHRRSKGTERPIVTLANHNQEHHTNSMHCAFCRAVLSRSNTRREHVFPNAIGGRKTINNFICGTCNNRTGTDWDATLVEQLRPLCTMLNVNRSRGRNLPFAVETISKRKLKVSPDGSMTIAKPLFEERKLGSNSEVRIHARTVREGRMIVAGLKKKHPRIDLDEVMKGADIKREYLREPYGITLDVGGPISGRSIIKTCLAMVYDAGLDISQCKEAELYLLKEGHPCFGYYNERDVVRNRPENIFFHCVHLRGDPKKGQLLAYVEYFGWLRIVACLSNDYEGIEFSHCHAIDPVSGNELDLDVELEFEPEDIQEIYEYKKVDFSETRRSLGVVLEGWRQMDLARARTHAIEDALQFACDELGIKEGDILPDYQIEQFARAVSRRLEPFLAHTIVGARLTENDLREIEQRLRG